MCVWWTVVFWMSSKCSSMLRWIHGGSFLNTVNIVESVELTMGCSHKNQNMIKYPILPFCFLIFFFFFAWLERWINKKKWQWMNDSLILGCDISFAFKSFFFVRCHPKKKINVNPLTFYQLATSVTNSFLFQSHQSESRNFMEALTAKLPNVIWSFFTWKLGTDW